MALTPPLIVSEVMTFLDDILLINNVIVNRRKNTMKVSVSIVMALSISLGKTVK